jgi:hypothetical protein
LMHRLILGVSNPKILVDHEDRDTFNCQRSNLRECNRSQNCSNVHKLSGTISKYMGVSLIYPKKKRWMAKIRVDEKQVYLGAFDNEKDAALAYNEAAKKYRGEFAFLNKIEP